MAADIIANPNIINTDHSSDNAYGVKETVNDAENGVVDIQAGGKIDNAWGGHSIDGIAKTNQASLSGGEAKRVIGGRSRNNDADNNQVSISAGTVGNSVIGGNSSKGIATNNHITITGGTVSYVYGGHSQEGTATNNHVSISGGTVEYVTGGTSYKGTATNNHVSISGGTFSGNIRAGYGAQTVSTVTDNTLTIEGGSFKETVQLWGYFGQAATTGGNSMHLKIAGLTIGNIRRFNNLYFYLPNSVNNGDNVATLKASSTDLSAAAIGVCAAAGSLLTVGDTVTLIQAQSLSTSSDTPPNTTAGMTGCSPDYEFTLEKVNNALIATVTKAPGGINTYSISGTVSGLSGTLVLQNNGGDNLTLTADGGFTFATAVADGGNYAVSVLAQPAGQNCSVNNAGGTVNGGPVTNIAVTCQTTGVPQQGTAQPVPGLGGKALALLMLILAAMTAWFIHRRSATAL